MGERVVGRPELPEEPGSLDGVGDNFGVHPVPIKKRN